MGNTNFNELLRSPHLLASMPIEDLEIITKNYPWFSLAQSYLAKAYQENKSHKTSGQIALASTLHSNRAWLYGFLKEPILQKHTAPELDLALPPEIIPETIVEVVPKAVAPSISSSSLAELAASMMDEEVKNEVREVKKDEEEVRKEVIEVKIKEEEVRQEVLEDKKEEEDVRDLDFLDKSILATAVSSSIFLEVSEADEELDATQDSSKGTSHDLPEDLSKNLATDASQGPAEEGESNALFTWLRSLSEVEEIIAKGRDEKKGEEEGRNSTESVRPSIDLIEKFIATEPRITPGKVEQYTGVSFAKESLEENFDWITETMAKLYAAQGKIDRARKAYKRLIQLHPEKKIHFENQLKVLNQRK